MWRSCKLKRDGRVKDGGDRGGLKCLWHFTPSPWMCNLGNKCNVARILDYIGQKIRREKRGEGEYKRETEEMWCDRERWRFFARGFMEYYETRKTRGCGVWACAGITGVGEVLDSGTSPE